MEETQAYQICSCIKDLSYSIADQLIAANNAVPVTVLFNKTIEDGPLGQIIEITNSLSPDFRLDDPGPYDELKFSQLLIKETEPNKSFLINTTNEIVGCDADGICICTYVSGNGTIKEINMNDTKLSFLSLKSG